MSSIQTAEEFLLGIVIDNNNSFDLNDCRITSDVTRAMIEFTRLRVEAALTEAHKAARWKEQITMQGLQVTISKASIMAAYPPENIK
jgi:hypothetical protein